MNKAKIISLCILLLTFAFCGRGVVEVIRNPAQIKPSVQTKNAAAPKPSLAPEGPFRYNYDNVELRLDVNAVLGSKDEFKAWQKQAKAFFANKWQAIPLPQMHLESVTPFTEITLPENATYNMFRVHIPLAGIDDGYGGLLTIPHTIMPDNPIIITMHGHEEKTSGKLPTNNFAEGRWMHQLANAGYIVYAPISNYHKPIESIANEHSYNMVWARLVSDAITVMKNSVFKEYPHTGIVSAGLSAGGFTAYFLTAGRDDIRAGIFAGCSRTPIVFFRDYYRFTNHLICQDVQWLDSFSTVMALIAPRPVLLIEGRNDDRFPGKPKQPPTRYYSGIPRSVTAEEFTGYHLLLKKIWSQSVIATQEREQALCQLYLHEGKHEFIAHAALDFLQQLRINNEQQK